MRQRRWLELIKDCTIEYQLVKANVVAVVLSRKTLSTLAHLCGERLLLLLSLRSMRIDLAVDEIGGLLENL